MTPDQREILRETARKHGLPAEWLIAHGRQRPIVLARQEAMWRMVKANRWSLPQLGRVFNRDHTTILWGYRAHERRQAEAA